MEERLAKYRAKKSREEKIANLKAKFWKMILPKAKNDDDTKINITTVEVNL